MKISSIKEKANGEKRIAITPESAKLLTRLGHEVWVEKSLGAELGMSDEDYIEAGAKVSSVPMEILSDADIILKVQLSPENESVSEKEFTQKNAIIMGMLSPSENSHLVDLYKSKGVNLLALELMPRTSLAQSFDVLSSQANLAGYRAVIEATYHYARAMPMLMTAAGTVQAAKVLVLGAGVAGLQAIATAKRLGAVVFAYDVRSAAKEQVESLGGKFIHPDVSKDFSSSSGYAKELDKDAANAQELMLESEISKFDIVITTAMIPGKKAPILITEKMVKLMKPGSVIVDLASASGGNCALSQKGSITNCNGVTIIAHENFAARIAGDASKLYAKNLYNLVAYLSKKENFLDKADEIVKNILL